jgi:chorismate mutase-like protein
MDLEKIVDLLSERARCAIEVGKIKRDSGQPMYAPERETAVLNQLKTLNKGPLSDEAIQRIFRQVIDEALRLEQEHADEES